jgi:hypothetical protein
MHQPGEWHASGNNTPGFCLLTGSETVQTAAYSYDAQPIQNGPAT